MNTQNVFVKIVLLGLALLCQWTAHGQPNNAGDAISLDGTSGYVSVPAGTWFSGDFTVEGWVFARSYNNWSRLIDFSDGPNNYNVYLALSDGASGYPTMGVFTNNNGTPILVANTQLPTNQWAHLAATLSGTNARIYINGKVVASGVLNIPPSIIRTNNYIGRSAYSGDAYANAIFDEVRIWNVARTQSQIEASLNHTLVGTESGLIGYWRFDEGSGTNAFDSSGKGQTATLLGGSTWTASTAPLTNFADYALGFSGSQSVTIPHEAAQDSYPLTVMCWFMAPANSTNGALVNKYVSSSFNGWQLAINSQYLYAWYYRDGSDYVGVTPAIAVNDGQWHHAAYVVDSNGGHIYVDGHLWYTSPWTGTSGACTPTTPLSLGYYPGNGSASNFRGDIDEVSVWNTALSASQIGTYMFEQLQGNESGLVAYYRIDEGAGSNIFDYTTNANTGAFSSPAPSWVLSGEDAWLNPVVSNLAATPASGGSATLSASVNPNGTGTAVWFAYGTTAHYGATNFAGYIGSGYNALTVTNALTNLALSTTYHFTAIASNTADTLSGPDAVFTLPGPPAVTNLAANVAFSNVTLSASVTPYGGTTAVWVAYGTTSNYSTTNFVGTIGNGFTPIQVTAVLSNLPVQTLYDFTFIASNSLGTTSGGNATFETLGGPPLVTNLNAIVTFTNVTLQAAVNPDAYSTAVWFAYGTTTNYGTTNSLGTIGSGYGAVLVSNVIGNLPMLTAYHYKVIAQNAAGIVNGADGVVQTPGYILGAASLLEGPQAGVDSVVLGGMPSNYAWTASATVPWLHLNSYTNGVGSQIVIFSFDQNPGATRIGALNFGQQSVAITQAGVTYVPGSGLLQLYATTNYLNGYLPLDSADNLYFTTSNQTSIMKLDYLTKAVTPVCSDSLGCYAIGVDAATNVYFFDEYATIERVPFGSKTPTLFYQPALIGNMAVAPSGDLFYTDYSKVYSLPHGAGPASTLFNIGTNSSMISWAADAADNLYLLFYTNSMSAGAVFKWSPANPTLIQLFQTYSPYYQIAVDGSGNIYFNPYSQPQKWRAATGTVVPSPGVPPLSVDNWGDGYASAYGYSFAYQTNAYLILENVNGFVNAQAVLEGPEAGTDSIQPVLPTTAYLGGTMTPVSTADWLVVRGVTNGTITFSFSSFHESGNRTAYINVLGISIPVVQGSPSYSLLVDSSTEGSDAGTDAVDLAVYPSGSGWTATANSPWLHLAPAMQSGAGSAPIAFSFDANPGPTRVGTLTLGGQTVTVTQAGASYVAVTNPVLVATITNVPTSLYAYQLAVDAGGDVFANNFGANGTNATYDLLTEWNPAANTVFSTNILPSQEAYFTADWIGNVYLINIDVSPAAVQKFNPTTGTLTTVFSTIQYFPYSFVVDSQGNITFFDAFSGSIVRYIPATGDFQTIATGFVYTNPELTVDPLGNVFWLYYDYAAGITFLKEWNAETWQTSILQSNTPAYSIAADASGNLDLLEAYQVQKLSLTTGSISTLPLPSTLLADSMTVDAGGNLYLGSYGSAGMMTVYEIPNAFVDPSPKVESSAGGSDVLPPVLPTQTDLLPPFAPTSDQLWLTVAGVSDGAVQFSFAPAATARAGNIIVLGLDTPVMQGTNFLLGTTNLVEGPAAGVDSFVFGTIPANAPWNASAIVSWLHIAPFGNGGGNIIFSYDANPGPTRSGTITIAGQTLTVTQAASTYVSATPLTYLTTSASGNGAPCGVALDRAGNVYYCDTYNNAVKVWNPTNNQITVLGSTGFNLPYALAVDPAGNVYIADTYNSVLKRWSPATSNITTVVSNGLNTPFGVAVDSAGNVYIGDSWNNAVKKWIPANNSMVTLYSSPGSQPMGVAVDAVGNVYWVEWGTGRVREWAVMSNSVTTVFANPGLTQPYGVAVDGSGNVYVANYDPDATYKWTAASGTVSSNVFNTIGVAVDAYGNQFIADAYDSLIYEVPRAFVDPTPRIESVAGGNDALPPVLPTQTDLLPPFAPTSDQPWLTIAGVSQGAVQFSFAPAPTVRYGNLTVLGIKTPVAQGTNIMLGTTNLVEGPAAGVDSFVFGTTPPSLPWSASANVSWLHIAPSGSGGGDIIFSYDANPGPTRSGTITIAGQTVTVTQAGSTYVRSSPQTTLASSGLQSPCGVALDAAGNVYFCDTYNNAVKMWTPTNNQITVLGSTGFNYPFALAVDPAGNVYIADTFNNVLKKWSPATTNITTVISNGLYKPYGVAVDSTGNVYISDSWNNAVKKYIPANNSIVTLYSNPGSDPVGVAVDAVGNVYWDEYVTKCIREWSVVSNTVTILFSNVVSEPYGVAVDGSGNVYVADYGNSATYKWTAASNTVSTVTLDATGVAVDGNQNIFIASYNYSFVYEVPRAFVDPTPRLEGLAGGPDALPPVLPTTENLLPPFAPTSGQPWASITGTAGDSIGFSVQPSPSPRATQITVYGQSVPIIQTNARPVILTGTRQLGPSTFQFSFTNIPNASFAVLSATNVLLPLTNWTFVGFATSLSPGVYQFTDLHATNRMRFYRVAAIGYPSFSLAAAPAVQTVAPGGTTNYLINVRTNYGFSGSIVLSVSGLPPGASAIFTPSSLNGAGSSTLSVTTSNATPTAPYPLTITGAGGGQTNSCGATLIVATAASPPPQIRSITVSGGKCVIAGMSALAGRPYYVLMSTNLGAPLNTWTRLATNLFDASGNFAFTNATGANVRQEFFSIQVP